MFRCLKPGCPVDCGTRKHPGCVDRMLCRALFLVLAALVVSFAIGFKRLSEFVRSTSVSKSSPFGAPEMIHLMSEAQDHARERILGDLHRKPEIPADEPIQVPQ